MNFLTGEHEFLDIRLVDDSETFVYAFEYRGDTFYCETVAHPTARELTDAILMAVREG